MTRARHTYLKDVGLEVVHELGQKRQGARREHALRDAGVQSAAVGIVFYLQWLECPRGSAIRLLSFMPPALRTRWGPAKKELRSILRAPPPLVLPPSCKCREMAWIRRAMTAPFGCLGSCVDRAN